MEDEEQESAAAAAAAGSPIKEKKVRKPVPLVYASWSEGARKMDEEMQKKLETGDERRLASIVSGLGSYEDLRERPENFVKGPRCLEKLKELQRCLTRDDPEKRRVFLQLGQWNIMGKYIVPIFLRYSEDNHIFLTALKVAILLTMPVDPKSMNTYDQVDYLCQFKEEFCEPNVIAAVVAHLEEPLANMEGGSVMEDDWRLLQLVLALIQNLLAIPEPMNWIGPYPVARYSQLRDGVLESFFNESVPDIVLAIARHLSSFQTGLRRENILVLQILHHMFWGQKPEVLFTAADNKHRSDSSRSGAPLNTNKELHKKSTSRHSHFSGIFVRVDQDGRKQVLTKTPFQGKEDTSQKPQTEGRKGRPLARDVDIPLPSTDGVSALLKEYADQLLTTGACNILMQTVKDDIRRERRDIETSDIVTFFQVAEFFISYQHYLFSKLLASTEGNVAVSSQCCGPISSTIDEEMFRMVLSKWPEYTEAAVVASRGRGEDHPKSVDWLPAISSAALLKEMMYILDVVLKNRTGDADRDVRMARTMAYKLLYDQTETGILNTTSRSIKGFNISKQPRSLLQNMVAITHVSLKLVETLTLQDGALRVSKKARKFKAKKKQDENSEKQHTEPEPDHIEDENADKPSSSKFTPRENAHENSDNHNNIDKETENAVQMDTEYSGQAEYAEEEGEDDNMEDNSTSVTECTLDVHKCVQKFADSDTVSKYCWLLGFYEENGAILNHFILCMLHRICRDCDLEPMLYQISILDLFHNILTNKRIAKLDEYRTLISFVTKVVRNFFKKLQSNPLLYVDVLFAKSRPLCRQINLDYTIHKLRGGKTGSHGGLADALGEDDDGSYNHLSSDGLRERLADALGEDEGGSLEHLSSDAPGLQSTRAGVAIRTAPVKRRKRGPFTEEDESRIVQLFEQFKEKRSYSKLIAEALSPDGTISAAQVARKLKQLGLHRGKRTPTEEQRVSLTESDEDRLSSDDPEDEDEHRAYGEELSKELEENHENFENDEDNEPIINHLKFKGNTQPNKGRLVKQQARRAEQVSDTRDMEDIVELQRDGNEVNAEPSTRRRRRLVKHQPSRDDHEANTVHMEMDNVQHIEDLTDEPPRETTCLPSDNENDLNTEDLDSKRRKFTITEDE